MKKAKEIASEVGLNAKFGVMVEVASTAILIEDFCKSGIAFASIGSNDLTMTTLGIDRNNSKIAPLYNELHPAVLKLIKHVIQTCNKYDIESSICGEAGSNPEMAKLLVRWGIKSISVEIDAIESIRNIIYKTERELLLEALRKSGTNGEFV